ncbi:proteasome subunit alpha type-5 [Latimeria chalumnae]|nr:PREDICTED: proteasome subunit alpha type-5 isoform X1 [Latimeria chalumnae]|eukprot:XP_005991764.2 PREDICTED: proteasome subunit alpha type-5 isoform X1 [Latimeria chalumnae]
MNQLKDSCCSVQFPGSDNLIPSGHRATVRVATRFTNESCLGSAPCWRGPVSGAERRGESGAVGLREQSCSCEAMFLTRSEYDRGVNTFSPEGRLFQVEYAIEAIKLGSTAIGIQTSEGVCLAVEKRITSSLMEPSSIEKIVEIDSHIGCAMSGLIADAKTLIDKARVETQNHWFTYNETMTVESVTQAVSNLALQFGEEDADPGAMSRPFGVALLFGGVDEKGPQLYHMDPSGTFVQCDARAIGSASEGAQSSLQEAYHKSMTLKEAIKWSLKILKQVMEEKLSATNIELATVEPGETFHMYTKEELETVIGEIKDL